MAVVEDSHSQYQPNHLTHMTSMESGGVPAARVSSTLKKAESRSLLRKGKNVSMRIDLVMVREPFRRR